MRYFCGERLHVSDTSFPTVADMSSMISLISSFTPELVDGAYGGIIAQVRVPLNTARKCYSLVLAPEETLTCIRWWIR